MSSASKVVNLASIKSASKAKASNAQIVVSPNGFPISTKIRDDRGTKQEQEDDNNKKSNPQALNFNDTAREVHKFGATGFDAKSNELKTFKEDEYFRLTGRHQKNAYVPLPMLRRQRKVHAERAKKQAEKIKESGVVVGSKKNKLVEKKMAHKKQKKNLIERYGPEPSIGHVKNGVFKYKQDRNRDGKFGGSSKSGSFSNNRNSKRKTR